MSNSIQNNELIFGLAIISILSKVEKLSISKSLLINPILSFKKTRYNLKNKKVHIRSIYELVSKDHSLLTNFNQRYIEYLNISINAIFLMKELELIDVNGSNLIFIGNKFDFGHKSLGWYYKERFECSEKLSKILNEEDVSNLYLYLQIEL